MKVAVTDRFHAKQGRTTGRLVLGNGQDKLVVYLKRHYRLSSWHRILATFWPNRGWSPALCEWHNLRRATALGLPVPRAVAAAEFIGPWFKLQSFLAVEELSDMVPLHEAIPEAARRMDGSTFRQWKHGLVLEIARVTSGFHSRRYFHKDLYLCHYYMPRRLIAANPVWHGQVHLIDLHRLGRHPLTWRRWQIKDLAELLYSSLIDGISVRDRLCFWRAYQAIGQPKLRGNWVRGFVIFKHRSYRRHNEIDEKSTPRKMTAPLDASAGNRLNIAICYERVMPARGGCETYIMDLACRLTADGHEVHLYASQWDPDILPAGVHCHLIPAFRGPRFLRPWFFSASCLRAARGENHDVTIGFDKTWGQDVLYPQGGLHVAAARHNLRKYGSRAGRLLATLGKFLDCAYWSYLLLERRQYVSSNQPLIIVNSRMVQRHFQRFYGIGPAKIRVIPSAIDTDRFAVHERPKWRAEWRSCWGIGPNETAGLFLAMNYRLKGLKPLLYATRLVTDLSRFKLIVAGSPSIKRYERLAHRLGIRDKVIFLGPRRDVHNCYFAADFLVHPTFYDPCSLVVLEALACGLAVITSRFNGASELLHSSRDGYVIENPHDHTALAQCMSELLDPSRRQAISRAAKEVALKWSFDDHYRQLLDVFAEAARRRKAA
jgi:UDP-glucose:(heptosyl)LPS alpha-1,3-glucosyltransferase